MKFIDEDGMGGVLTYEQHMERLTTAVRKEKERMERLYQAVSQCIDEDRNINLTRLHDYTFGEDIPADSIVGDPIDRWA